jgi:hypothetical protein
MSSVCNNSRRPVALIGLADADQRQADALKKNLPQHKATVPLVHVRARSHPGSLLLTLPSHTRCG